MSDQERKLFEDALEGEAHFWWISEVGQYNSTITQQMWKAWQRARQAPASGEVEPVDNWWQPECCPVTQLPFFMWITHPDDGWVPTYGGPYDSYTIPALKDGSYLRQKFDHDEGCWLIDEFEDVGLQIVDDQLYVTDRDPDAHPPAKVPESLDFELIADILADYMHLQTSGEISGANRYAVSCVNEQIELITTHTPEAEWVKCEDHLPKVGQRVQLFSQGVIQGHMPIFDEDDEGLFWDFEIQDHNPRVDFERDQWRPMPTPPQEQ